MTQGVRDQPMRGQYPGHVITLHQSEARNDTRGERSVVMNNIWQSPAGGERSGGNIVMKCDEWKMHIATSGYKGLTIIKS